MLLFLIDVILLLFIVDMLLSCSRLKIIHLNHTFQIVMLRYSKAEICRHVLVLLMHATVFIFVFFNILLKSKEFRSPPVFCFYGYKLRFKSLLVMFLSKDIDSVSCFISYLMITGLTC